MATISFTPTFDLTQSNPAFSALDTTNWAGQGIATADVNGCFNIVSPSGVVVYNNTDYTNANCDIRTALSLTSQQSIALPLTAASLVEPGDYIITYTQYNSALSVYYTQVATYTYEYISPEVCISQVIDCISPQFTSTDITEYVVDGVTPTKTLTHTIYYPNGSVGQGSPLVGSAAVLSTGVFYNGTQTSEIEADLSYTFTDGLIVLDNISASKDIKVNCEYICSIYCCIRALEQQLINTPITVNKNLYAQLSDTFQTVMSFVGLAQVAINCGKSDDVNCYLEKIMELTNCTSDCSCSGDEPSRVSGLGGLINEVVVNSGGTPVIVTPVIVGNTTTYSITLSSSFVTTVNSLYNSVVAAGVNVTSVGVVTAGLTKTYTVNVEDAAVAAGSNISVSSSFVSPTTTYTVSANLDGANDWDATTDTIAAPADIILPNISVTVPATGSYLVMFNAYAIVSGAGDCKYQFYINGAALPTNYKRLGGISALPQDMTLCYVGTLTSGHVVQIQLTDGVPNMTIDAKSLNIIKIA